MFATSFRLLPEQASTHAPSVDGLFWYITSVCVFFTLLIAVLLMFFAVRYRRRSEDYFPTPLVGSKKLEITWSVIPLILALVMFFWGASIYINYFRPPDNCLEVYVIGKQWMWHLQHPGGASETNQLHVPMGRPVKLIMTSEDVIHDFYVPDFRVKMDVVPGKYTYLWFEATKAGTYHIFCAQYCGTDHSRMIGQVVVMEPQEYETWVTQQPFRSMAMEGKALFQKLQCNTCHNSSPEARAPNLEGLYGTTVPLDDGRRVLADEAYLRESILLPEAKVVAGWKPIMPPYDKQVNQQEMNKLVEYLKGLKRGGYPQRVQNDDPPERKGQEAPPVKDKDKAKAKVPEKGPVPAKDKEKEKPKQEEKAKPKPDDKKPTEKKG